uniref:Uncharacterized protein n=1 Tax=viral metagenome TaxID=1070528 RepID=A0A6M3IX19_9ZZZZ
MNGRIAKKLRREALKVKETMFPELKAFINGLSFRDRVKVAWRIMGRRF